MPGLPLDILDEMYPSVVPDPGPIQMLAKVWEAYQNMYFVCHPRKVLLESPPRGFSAEWAWGQFMQPRSRDGECPAYLWSGPCPSLSPSPSSPLSSSSASSGSWNIP